MVAILLPYSLHLIRMCRQGGRGALNGSYLYSSNVYRHRRNTTMSLVCHPTNQPTTGEVATGNDDDSRGQAEIAQQQQLCLGRGCDLRDPLLWT